MCRARRPPRRSTYGGRWTAGGGQCGAIIMACVGVLVVCGNLHLLKAVRFKSSQTIDRDVRITSELSGQLSPLPMSGTLLSPGQGGHHEFSPGKT